MVDAAQMIVSHGVWLHTGRRVSIAERVRASAYASPTLTLIKFGSARAFSACLSSLIKVDEYAIHKEYADDICA